MKPVRTAMASLAVAMAVLGGVMVFGAQPAGAVDGPLEVTTTMKVQDFHDGQTVNVSYQVRNTSLVNPLYLYNHQWGWYTGPQVNYSYSNSLQPHWLYNPQGITCSPPANGYRLSAHSSTTIACTVRITGGGWTTIRPLFAVKAQRCQLGQNCPTFTDSATVDIHPIY